MKTKNTILFLVALFFSSLFILINGCKKDSDNTSVPDDNECGSLTVNYEGQVYHTILIGDQCWLKENLNIGTRINGMQEQTDNGTIEKFCYDDNESNCDEYGGLYQWDEMMQYASIQGSRGICPLGWHVPTDDEWKVLEGNVESQYGVDDPVWDNTGTRGYDAGKKLKSKTGWYLNGNGTNDFDFTALPVGFRYIGMSGFVNLEKGAGFWTSTDHGNTDAWRRYLMYTHGGVNRGYVNKVEYGFSIRCLKD